jgi:hypothetical protein
MATTTEQSDFEAILQARAEGRKVDPVIEKRVRERAEQARQNILNRFGVQNIGTDIIREHRDAHSDG